MAITGKSVTLFDAVAADRYDDELLSANWNPVIARTDWSRARRAAEILRPRPHTVREEDAEAFLGRFYKLGA